MGTVTSADNEMEATSTCGPNVSKELVRFVDAAPLNVRPRFDTESTLGWQANTSSAYDIKQMEALMKWRR
jgi:hypothetical protein